MMDESQFARRETNFTSTEGGNQTKKSFHMGANLGFGGGILEDETPFVRTSSAKSKGLKRNVT